MKNKLVLAMTVIAVSTAWMTGCSSTSGTSAEEGTSSDEVWEETQETDGSDAADTEASEEIANPWTESDEQGVAQATGFDMTPPDGAKEVAYSYLAEEGLAQMSYELEDAKWVYRMESADALTDISGLHMDWTGDEGTVSGREAMYYGQCDPNDETTEDVMLVNWYDVVTGVTYSLSATGTDLSGMDMQVYAENLYVPSQGDATDDPAADRENELKSYFLGEHKKSEDGSSLVIADNGDGTFRVDLSITRLCSLEDGVGTFAEHKMTFTAADPNGEDISAMIYRDSDNSLVVRITNSTWEYLPNDEVIDGFGK